MSPARRLFVLAGFTLMVAGIVLLLSQEEEIFVALSVLGFVVVVAAVPRLERGEAGAAPATSVQPAPAVEPPTGTQPPTGDVTVVSGEPTLEHPAVADPEAFGDGQEPRPEPSEPPAPAPEPEPAEPVPAEKTPEPAPAEPESEPAEPELAEPAPAFPAPERWGSWRPPADAQGAPGSARPRARTVAVAGAAVTAAAALWAWRRARR